MTPVVFGADGKQIKLGTRLGKGGEGEVYAVDGSPDRAVKLYTVANKGDRESKVRKMIADGLAQKSKLIAFPIAPLRDRAGQFTGFTMEKVSGHKALHELYSPGARKSAFPRADYRFLVRTAANIARAVATAHAASCVIGDINHSGILVSDRATATLIDADSFQVIDGAVRYLCKVGVPEYTPPELQGQRLDTVMRTQNHDAFGLAIVVFQLLWMGRHPFSGRPQGPGDMPIEKAIREYRFAYSRTRSVGLDAPPAVPKLTDFPTALAAAFEQAFAPDGVRERPTARHWIALLDELERSLKICSANSLHYYPAAAPECPWCRMESHLGVQLFVPNLAQFEHGASFSPIIGDITTIWRAIEAIQAPVLAASTFQTPILAPTPEAVATKEARWKPRAIGAALLVVAALVLFGAPSYFFFALVAGGFGIAQLAKKSSGDQEMLRKYRDAESNRMQAEQERQKRSSTEEFENLKSSLMSLKAEFDSLPATERQRVQAYTANRRSEQLKQFLDGFQIRQFKIPHVGPAKLAMLTSFGIETAADVNLAAVQNVPGFGPVNSIPLIEWRKGLETRFVYNPNPTTADTVAINGFKVQLARRAAEIKSQLGTGPERLTKLAASIQQGSASLDPMLRRLHEQKAQAIIDLRFLGLPIPTVQPPQAPRAIAPVTPRPVGTSHPTRCPQCGSLMVLRTARRGPGRGRQFYGCSRYPGCKGTRPAP